MRVLPYFNNVQLPVHRGRTVEVKETGAGAPHNPLEAQSPKVAAGAAPGTDVFIPSSPVSGVVHSYKTVAAGKQVQETIIKSGNYSFYKLNGSIQSRENGNVGGKLDLKG